ncbi:MAG: endonuclease/exonuclease/phosphatase family protein, partial [Treponema sp.]|nr:endonuclease/exonuclease/phosphatase family protein [Treponema sp.]
MKKLRFGTRVCRLAAFFTVVFFVLSCTLTKTDETPAAAGSLTLMTWNVQNLFDGIDRETKYDEFRETSGWTTEKYQGRVNTIASALSKVEPAPDIIIFQEVESLGILEAIASSLSGDTWSHFAGNPGAALGLGIISRYPLLESKIHSITTNGQTTPRPVLETRVQAGEGKLVIFACHWKSKIGSDEVT